jgi:hypothetical protein
MIEYQIQPNTRRCIVSGRELRPGERYFTALLEEPGGFVRQDNAAEAWQGPPPAAFGFWSGRVPTPSEPIRPRFDEDLLEECFHRLTDQTEPSRINFRYVVALLLIRRKRFRFERTLFEDGVEKLETISVKTGQKHLVVNPQLTDEEMSQVQAEVFQVLGWS